MHLCAARGAVHYLYTSLWRQVYPQSQPPPRAAPPQEGYGRGAAKKTRKARASGGSHIKPLSIKASANELKFKNVLDMFSVDIECVPARHPPCDPARRRRGVPPRLPPPRTPAHPGLSAPRVLSPARLCTVAPPSPVTPRLCCLPPHTMRPHPPRGPRLPHRLS